ncbi:MAG: M48 family metallopeptidase [Lachnospiraceae bacterium]|nr:M48 family metallopeptidase [Lachnospiraceae bacterium]
MKNTKADSNVSAFLLRKMTFGDIPVKITYSKRRTLSMKFDMTGTLIVSAPGHLTEAEVRQFMDEKSRWIRTNYVRIMARAEKSSEYRVEEGGKVLYLGEELNVHIGGHGRVKKIGKDIYFPEGADKESYVRWLKARAGEYLPSRLQSIAWEMGITYRELRITGARSKWGSCSETGKITLSWHLCMCPPEAIEYVMIHELCHRLHMDHSRDFWAEVERRMPDYKKYKKWLDDNSYLMDMI